MPTIDPPTIVGTGSKLLTIFELIYYMRLIFFGITKLLLPSAFVNKH